MVILQLKEQPRLIQAIFAGLADVEQYIDHPDYANGTDCEKRTALHAAAFKGDPQIASILLEHGARVNAKDSKWVTPLHRACAVDSEDTIDVLLYYQADVCARDRLWQTPLHIAAAHDAYNCVRKLLYVVPNPNVTDRSGRTALHHAAYNGNTFVAELLIERGCIVNACDKKDCRPLHCAVQLGHIDTVEHLLRYGADINAKDRNQYTPLHVAAAGGVEAVTRLLLNSGAEVNAQNAYGNTPLHVACLNGHLACCHELALAGADIEAVNFRGQTPVHVAAASTHGVYCLALLLTKGVDINRCSTDGRTPLHMTAIHGRFTRSKTLIDKGALIDCADKNGSTPLHIAAQYGHDILANTLLSYGASPTKKGYEGRTPLHMCCLSGYVECCRKFLQTGVNLNEKDDSGRTPTHCAAYKGSIECLDLLTSNGADFKLKDSYARLPLHYAAAQGHFQCVFTLVGIGSPINDRDIEGCTPLHLAAAYDHEAKCVEYLLSHRADPKIRDARGFSTLHYAIACGNVEGVKLLLNVTEESVFKKEGGSPDITPLHLAAKLGNVEVLRSVLTKYSDVNIQTEHGITPLILVAREGHIQCVHFLLRFGAKVSLCDNVNLMTAVHYSAKNGHSQCLTLLLHNSEDQHVVNMVDRQQRTALMLAVSGNHIECVQALLKCGADPNIVDTDEHSCLFRAVVNGQHNVVQLLLSSNAEVKTRDVNGKTALHLAAACGHLMCLQLLMEYMKEEDVLSKDNQECTVLHWACYHAHAHCVEHLLAKQLFKELEGNSYSPVHCACFSGSEMCLEHLITHFGDKIVRLKDDKQRTPLHIAALHGHNECATLLLKHGAEPQVVDEEGRTPIIAAAQYGQSSLVELLLTRNIQDLSACDNDGNTALHWACLNKHHQTALLLLENCHDAKLIDISNNERKTSLHLAARNGLVDVTRELLKKGANVLAVDNEGLTPALCCAPSYNVAQCLALILQTLPDFLGKVSAQEDNAPVLIQNLNTIPSPFHPKSLKSTLAQTDVVLVKDPDLFELKTAFFPSKDHKITKSAIKVDSTNDFFIKEAYDSQGAIPKVWPEKGKKLHRSEKEIHIPTSELIFFRQRKKISKTSVHNLPFDRITLCKECQKFQKQCLNCQIREEIKQAKKKRRLEKTKADPSGGVQSLSSLKPPSSCHIQPYFPGQSSPCSKEQSPSCLECQMLGKKCVPCQVGEVLKRPLKWGKSYEVANFFLEKYTKTIEVLRNDFEYKLDNAEEKAGQQFEKEHIFGASEKDIDFGQEFEEKMCEEIEKNIQICQNSMSCTLQYNEDCRNLDRDDASCQNTPDNSENDIQILYLKNDKGHSKRSLNFDSQYQNSVCDQRDTENIEDKPTGQFGQGPIVCVIDKRVAQVCQSTRDCVQNTGDIAPKTDQEKEEDKTDSSISLLPLQTNQPTEKTPIDDGRTSFDADLPVLIEKHSTSSQTDLYSERCRKPVLHRLSISNFDVSSDMTSYQNDNCFDVSSFIEEDDATSLECQDGSWEGNASLIGEDALIDYGAISDCSVICDVVPDQTECQEGSEPSIDVCDIERCRKTVLSISNFNVSSDMAGCQNDNCFDVSFVEEDDATSLECQNGSGDEMVSLISEDSLVCDINSDGVVRPDFDNPTEKSDFDTLMMLKKKSRKTDVGCSIC